MAELQVSKQQASLRRLTRTFFTLQAHKLYGGKPVADKEKSESKEGKKLA